jgi:hypothetical protein
MEQVALAADPFDLNFAHRIFGLSASSSGAYFQSQIEVLANQGFGGVVRGETTRLVSRLETGEDIAAAARELGISFRAGNGDMLNSDDVENFTAEERDQSFRNREGFVGFQFEDAANNEQLGWVRVVGGVETNGYTVLDYAFTTSGEPLFAGQTTAVAIPEPAGLGMLAFGAVGLVALRRREREQQ